MNAIPKMGTRSRLKAVAPKTTEPKKSKSLWFGGPGVGKSTAALQWPGVYFIDAEGGATLNHYQDILANAGGAYMGPNEGAASFPEVIEQVKALATEQHDYRTLVIDSISYLYNAAIAEEADRLKDKDAFGASKKPAVQMTRLLLNWIAKIDMNVILIAHQKDTWSDSGKTGVTFDGYDKIEYALDLTLNVVKTGPRRFARVGKSRLLAFPEGDTFDWSYEAFADRYGRDVIEREARPIEIASAEQVAELNRLLEIVKLPEGTLEKWLKAAGVDAFEDMEASKIDGCIASLKGKLA